MISIEQLSSEPWGTLPGGDPVRLFTLRNAHGMKIAISDLGATLVSWHAPDRAGRLGDILLGHDTPAEYVAATTYMGGLIGRWANRIADARFTLDGIEYTLDRNEGANLLHGGTQGFHRALWDVSEDNGALVMRLESPEGDAGFPGNVTTQVRYSLDDDGTLTIDYEAITDAATPLNLTSHPYFNLTGRPGADIRGHVLSIDADRFFEVDAALIPTRLAEVAGNAFDFRQSAPIGARLDWPHAQLARAGGFDHCYVLGEASAPGIREVACAYDPGSGRELTVFTDQRGLQFYSGNALNGNKGRGGIAYQPHAGLCLEAGGFPNQVNMADEQDAVIVQAGDTYRQVTRYRVGVRSGV
ncbi:aldose epimerase family protein [Paraburkholderia terricola]|jgi:aldose 1-epimerase|uniref:Aldose 1-epimerase n=1 Tax=Paraburkholderia terricola TaxID=169427 RepID=A0A1M6WSX5_9BURK|nr:MULTISPECIES: aldose epimerase family protein [Paraburkholderia]AXE95531.1 galactose-1-epimerase [Paraburkholderia terricola]SDP22415.1 aldose 1-epimerase [Paraburkholderia sediminicola]SHK96870.1 aldose 1-epimerase [Paraburkholderia terricola]